MLSFIYYIFPCINEYLIKLYQNKKDSLNYSNSNITNFNNIDFYFCWEKHFMNTRAFYQI